jgi:hypothetical protein
MASNTLLQIFARRVINGYLSSKRELAEVKRNTMKESCQSSPAGAASHWQLSAVIIETVTGRQEVKLC